MTKNVSVIDENGIVTGSTYPKRASGLVKKGRARWIDDETICLCAPKKEEKQMNLYEVFDNQISKMQEQIKDDELFTPENVLARETTRQKMLDLMSSFCNNQKTEE